MQVETRLDVTNYHAVCADMTGRVFIEMPPYGGISRQRALVLAAWLVAVVGATEAEFRRVLRAVQSS